MKKDNCAVRLKRALSIRDMKQSELSLKTGIPKSAISQYVSGAFEPKQDRVEIIAKALDVSEAWLMGYDIPMERESTKTQERFPQPNITEAYTSFPVIGDVAAGYNHVAYEDWSGEKVDIPDSFLRGYPKEDFFALQIIGDSMYPMYQDGDVVLILKQSAVNSGDIGLVIYDDDLSTLKKVEFKQGENWLKLVPLNPMYKPELIEGVRLETCHIIGVPYLLIREFNQII